MSRDSSAAWPAGGCGPTAAAAAVASCIIVAGPVGAGAAPRALGGGASCSAPASWGIARRGTARGCAVAAASGCCSCCVRRPVPGASTGPSSRGRSAKLARSDSGGTRRLRARGGTAGAPPRGLPAGLASLLAHELLASLLSASLLQQLRLLWEPLEAIRGETRQLKTGQSVEPRLPTGRALVSRAQGRRGETGATRG